MHTNKHTPIPLEIGFDCQMVQAAAARTQPELGPHAAELQMSASFSDSFLGTFSPSSSVDCTCKTLFAWKAPVSPHLAAQREGQISSFILVISLISTACRTQSSHLYPASDSNISISTPCHCYSSQLCRLQNSSQDVLSISAPADHSHADESPTLLPRIWRPGPHMTWPDRMQAGWWGMQSCAAQRCESCEALHSGQGALLTPWPS